jgi:hypothetical protein
VSDSRSDTIGPASWAGCPHCVYSFGMPVDGLLSSSRRSTPAPYVDQTRVHQATQLVVEGAQTATIWRGVAPPDGRQGERDYPALALVSLTSTKGAPQAHV